LGEGRISRQLASARNQIKLGVTGIPLFCVKEENADLPIWGRLGKRGAVGKGKICQSH
jgi:hypothetical protein